MKYNNLLEAIGNTPHLKLNKLFPNHHVWIKLEKQNPGASIKDRIALAMIEAAERDNLLHHDSIIVEPSSGNTGVGLSWVGLLKGYKVVIVMPESMSLERRRIITAYGAELVLTPKELGMKGAIEKAKEITNQNKNAINLQQFINLANPLTHAQITAKEIINDFKSEKLDYFISGVGTGGHISGIGEVLKQQYPNLQVLAVEPADSPVISGGEPGSHGIQGIGAGFIPDTLNVSILDGSIQITKEEAFAYTEKLSKTEGLLAGISTGASIAAVAKVLETAPKESTVLTVNYDTGERYFSVDGLFS